MNHYKKVLKAVAFALLAAVPVAAYAVGETLIQETPTDPRSAIIVATGTGTAQQTLTLTCGAGQFVYLVYYEEVEMATTAPAATLLTTTTTNLGGQKWYQQVAATATESPRVEFLPPHPLKGTSNSATIVSNAAVTSVNYGLTAGYFCAP